MAKLFCVLRRRLMCRTHYVSGGEKADTSSRYVFSRLLGVPVHWNSETSGHCEGVRRNCYLGEGAVRTPVGGVLHVAVAHAKSDAGRVLIQFVNE